MDADFLQSRSTESATIAPLAFELLKIKGPIVKFEAKACFYNYGFDNRQTEFARVVLCQFDFKYKWRLLKGRI